MDFRFKNLVEITNYFNSFGFVRIPQMLLPQAEAISSEFDALMQAKFGNTNDGAHYLHPQFIDQSAKLTSLLSLPIVTEMMSALLGDDFLYAGSDGHVRSAGTPWHRNSLTRTKTIRMLVNLEPHHDSSAALRLIPGSQFVDDAFSAHLGAALAWPEEAKQGGFDDHGAFGQNHDPLVPGKNQTLPHTVISNNIGDVIIFNQNIIHCVNTEPTLTRRRFLGMNFSVNPKTRLFGKVEEETVDELRAMSLLEMQTYRLPSLYGRHVANSTSPAVQRMILPLKALRIEPKGEFKGKNPPFSDRWVRFSSRLKSEYFQTRDFVN